MYNLKIIIYFCAKIIRVIRKTNLFMNCSQKKLLHLTCIILLKLDYNISMIIYMD